MSHPCGIGKRGPPAVLLLLLTIFDTVPLVGGILLVLQSFTLWSGHRTFGDLGEAPGVYLLPLQLPVFLRFVTLLAIGNSLLYVHRQPSVTTGSQSGRRQIDRLFLATGLHMVLSVIILIVYTTQTYKVAVGQSLIDWLLVGPVLAFAGLSLEVLLMCLIGAYYEDYRQLGKESSLTDQLEAVKEGIKPPPYTIMPEAV